MPGAPKKKKRRLKAATLLLGMMPISWIAWRFFTDGLGANPIEAAMNKLGWWTLTILLASLVATPAKIVLGWNWPLQVRKLLGLIAFFYASMHFLFYAVVDQGLAVGEIWKDIVKRNFITVGLLGLVLLIPLAVTSTKGWVKRLGFARWKALHRLVYVAAAAGVVHFVWRVKADFREPAIFGFVLAVLLGVRVVDFLRARGRGKIAATT